MQYKSEAQICDDALTVQTASNLSGVVHAFADVCSFLMAEKCDSFTIRKHPAVKMFADKIQDMIGVMSFDEWKEVEKQCQEMAKKE